MEKSSSISEIERTKENLPVIPLPRNYVSLENKMEKVSVGSHEIPTEKLMQELNKKRSLLKSVNLDRLPDNGHRLKMEIKALENEIGLRTSRESKNSQLVKPQHQITNYFKLDDKSVKENKTMPHSNIQPGTNYIPKSFITNVNRVPISQIYHVNKAYPLPPTQRLPNYIAQPPMPPNFWRQYYAANPQVQSLYGGRMTQARKDEVKSVTTDAIEKMHKSLQTCPAETDEVSDPLQLQVSLLPHQRQALAWMLWREKQHPSGGILADDMGLGKTLTVLSLILKKRQIENEVKKDEITDKSLIPSRASLIICPASLIQQWAKEIDNRIEKGALRYVLYHGVNRDKDARKLANFDIVITSYELVRNEIGAPSKDAKEEKAVADANILSVVWETVVLDEGHSIKNSKSKTALAVCRLRAKSRWVCTGTPVHNDLLDMYSLLRFLRCTPFDELKVWKHWVDNKSESSQRRLKTIVRGLMLRRTKDQVGTTGERLISLPPKLEHLHNVMLSADEQRIYDKVFDISKSSLANYLKQQKQKKDDEENGISTEDKVGLTKPSAPIMRASDFLVLLLRLRQCCCHLSLIKSKSDQDAPKVEEDFGDDLVAGFANLSLSSKTKPVDTTSQQQGENEAVAVKTIIDSIPEDTPYFKLSSQSAKIKLLLEKLEEIHTKDSLGIKSILISQWTGVLRIVEYHLEQKGFKYHSITGDVPMKTRVNAIDDFNNNISGSPIMLLSLKAGGVGLNLIGGSHVFLLDIHWNPQLENQACDRVYRVGQKREVHIHKFLCEKTVEEKISHLQKKKLSLASNVLSGTKVQVNRLTLDDLKMLFGVTN